MLVRVTLVVTFDFLSQNFQRWWDLWVLFCHSVTVGCGYSTLPAVRKNMNFLRSQVMGMQKHFPCTYCTLVPRPPGETFTSYFLYFSHSKNTVMIRICWYLTDLAYVLLCLNAWIFSVWIVMDKSPWVTVLTLINIMLSQHLPFWEPTYSYSCPRL